MPPGPEVASVVKLEPRLLAGVYLVPWKQLTPSAGDRNGNWVSTTPQSTHPVFQPKGQFIHLELWNLVGLDDFQGLVFLVQGDSIEKEFFLALLAALGRCSYESDIRGASGP